MKFLRICFSSTSKTKTTSLPTWTLTCMLSESTTEGAISTALRSVFIHNENKNSYIRMMFFDFSTTINPTYPNCKTLPHSHTIQYWTQHQSPSRLRVQPLLFTLYLPVWLHSNRTLVSKAVFSIVRYATQPEKRRWWENKQTAVKSGELELILELHYSG